MAGNKNSGRKNEFEVPVQIHFYMEKNEVDKLNKIAKKFANNNRSRLIIETLRRLISSYEGSQ